MIDYFKLISSFGSDVRTKFNTLYFISLKFLIDYDKYKEETEFENNYFKCIICFKKYYDKHCIKHKNVITYIAKIVYIYTYL